MAQLTPPPVAPQRGDRSTFSGRVDAFLTWMSNLVGQLNIFISNLTTLASGGANAYAYFFDTTTTDADPGAGKIRLGTSPQNGSTVLRISTTTGAGTDLTGFLFVFQGGSSNVKGSIRLQKLNEPSSWMVLDVTSGALSGGYRNLTVVVRAFSSANPFANGDSLMVYFDRVGDKGDGGNTPTQQQIRDALGTLPISNGGTGATAAPAALTNLGAMPLAGGTFTGNTVYNNGVQLQIKDAGGTPRAFALVGSDNQLSMSIIGGVNLRILDQNFANNLWMLTNSGDTWQSGSHTFENMKGLKLKDPSGTVRSFMSMGNDGGVSWTNSGGTYTRWLNQAFTTELMRLTDGGALTVATSISSPSITQTSDERLKSKFTPITDAQLDALADIDEQGTFEWLDGSGESLGAGANAIGRIIPQAKRVSEQGIASLEYGGATMAVLLAHLRRSERRNAELQERVRALELHR